MKIWFRLVEVFKSYRGDKPNGPWTRTQTRTLKLTRTKIFKVKCRSSPIKITNTEYASLYRTDLDYAMKVKMMLAIAFVPLDHIDKYFDALLEELLDEHKELADWFEDNYLGHVNRHGMSR